MVRLVEPAEGPRERHGVGFLVDHVERLAEQRLVDYLERHRLRRGVHVDLERERAVAAEAPGGFGFAAPRACQRLRALGNFPGEAVQRRAVHGGGAHLAVRHPLLARGVHERSLVLAEKLGHRAHAAVRELVGLGHHQLARDLRIHHMQDGLAQHLHLVHARGVVPVLERPLQQDLVTALRNVKRVPGDGERGRARVRRGRLLEQRGDALHVVLELLGHRIDQRLRKAGAGVRRPGNDARVAPAASATASGGHSRHSAARESPRRRRGRRRRRKRGGPHVGDVDE